MHRAVDWMSRSFNLTLSPGMLWEQVCDFGIAIHYHMAVPEGHMF